MAIPMHPPSHHRFFGSLTKAVQALQLAPALKVAHDADDLEAAYGEESLDRVRARILRADRTARRGLYRLHDELARRRREEAGNPLAGLMA